MREILMLISAGLAIGACGALASGAIFLPPVTVSTGTGGYWAVALADLDGDGDLDIAAADRANKQLRFFRNLGDLAFTELAPIGVGQGAFELALGDLDDDGDIDAVVTNQSDDTITFGWNNGDATFEPPSVLGVLDGPTCVVVSDVNVDGLLDIVVCHFNGSRVIVLRNFGERVFQTRGSYAMNSPTGIATGRLDTDSLPDLAMCNSVGVTAGTDRSDGQFGGFASTTVGGDPQDLVITDLNGDGYGDVGIASDDGLSPNTRGLYVLLGNGAGSLGAPIRYQVFGSLLRSVVFGRLDAGASVDAITVAWGSSQISVQTNDGTGVFTRIESYFTALKPTDCALGDMDGDSDLDVVVVSEIPGVVQVFANQRFHPKPFCPADIDGSLDVSVADFSILAAHFGEAVTPNTLGDLNGDGLVNIADFTIFASAFGRTCP